MTYFYELTILPSQNRVLSEILRIDSKLLVEREGEELKLLNANGVINERKIHNFQFSLSLRRSVSYDPRISIFCNKISSWGIYSFEPKAIRGYANVLPSSELSRDGSNLPQVLHTLLTTNRETFRRIEDTLKMCLPEVDEIDLPVIRKDHQPEVHIAIRERGFEKPFELAQISDGTLRLLAFITALNLDSPLVAFEKPENCVHPHLLETLIDIVRKSDKQVIISTHSPLLIRLLQT